MDVKAVHSQTALYGSVDTVRAVMTRIQWFCFLVPMGIDWRTSLQEDHRGHCDDKFKIVHFAERLWYAFARHCIIFKECVVDIRVSEGFIAFQKPIANQLFSH